MKIHHLAIQVYDLERAADFYRSLFDLKELRRQAHSVWFSVGGAILMLEKCERESMAQPWRSEAPGLFVLALAVTPSERASLREKLSANKIKIEHETQFTTYFRDPDGNRLAISHYPETGVSSQ